MKPTFIHLKLHTEYSLSDGLLRIEEVVEAAKKLSMPAIAVTDQVNLFAAVKFYREAVKAGIKPILGADCWLQNSNNPSQPFKFILLCKNYSGYLNLTRLISKAYLEGQQTGQPIIEKNWLAESAGDLLAISGGLESDIGQALLADNTVLAKDALQFWSETFPNNFYLEISRVGKAQEEEYIRLVLEFAAKNQVPVVATNDVRFLANDDYEAHEARVCIHEGFVLNDNRRPKRYTPQQYLRSQQEMQELFKEYPEVLMNTVEIAKRCNLQMQFGKTFLPDFPIPPGLTIEKFLAEQAEQGLKKRLEVLNKNEEQAKVYYERLAFEIDVIVKMGFPGYFLIVADFIRWARENKIPVGPGRGSGAGSLVAYALQITDIDPLPYDLLFERFLNPERVSMPDFDVDFCMDKRDRVIEYVNERYGRDAVSQIITYGTMAAKAVVRDVGRVLGYPYGMVDKLAKLIPFELGITLEKALKQEEQLRKRYNDEDEVRVLIDLALKLEGLCRNVGKHAAGVVIAPSKLTNFTPLYCEPGGENLVTQFDFDDIQEVGLVKFDFLGLRTLTIIDWAVDAINERRKKNNESLIDIAKIPLDDSKTYDLLKACSTTAVFQLESRGMKELIKRLKPDCFEDIISLVALFRPGPLQSGMVDDFVERKHGQAKVEYMHAMLETILRPTYGVVIYQEQVMQIAQVLAGYTLGGADFLRRAMGKKKADEMAKHRAIFRDGAKANKIEEKAADEIFDKMEKFAEYGFNKSHSAAYALVSYQTAWLKTHFPAEFMAAVLSSDMEKTEKVVTLLDECRSMKLKVLPPDVNRSGYKFAVTDDYAINYGLGAIKGVGEAAIEAIIESRKESGAFKDLFDLCLRVDLRKMNRRVLEALINSGSFDSFGLTRASLHASLELVLQSAEQHFQAVAEGQHDLFSTDEPVAASVNMIIRPEFSDEEKLQGEKDALGFYLTGHPIQRYEYELKNITSSSISELNPNRNKTVVVGGWIIGLRVMFTKRGDRMAIVTMEDRSSRIELTIFSDVYNDYQHLLEKDKLVIVEGEVNIDEYTGGYRILVKKLFSMTDAREHFAKAMKIKIKAENFKNEFPQNLQQVMAPFCPGRCPVLVEYHRKDSSVDILLGQKWKVKPADDLIKALNCQLNCEIVMEY